MRRRATAGPVHALWLASADARELAELVSQLAADDWPEIFATAGGVEKVRSWPVGSGVLADELISSDPPSASEIRKPSEYAPLRRFATPAG